MLEAGDHERAKSRDLAVKERYAVKALRRFLADPSECYVSSSWGKDSVVIAHLARRVEDTLPVVHGAWRQPYAEPRVGKCGTIYDAAENPHNDDVRDDFLARWPMPYAEVECSQTQPWHAPIKAEFGPRRITGIRAQESGTRTMSAAVHGVATGNVCRPILNWSADDVFAYLAKYDLPIHPSYAMSYGGRLDRTWLRVDLIGGGTGVDMGRREWERRYYGNALSHHAGGLVDIRAHCS